MIVRACRQEDLRELFAYWTGLGRTIPYFFPVSPERWRTCLLEDTLDGQRTFECLETHLALEGKHVLGFIQLGRPSFSWDGAGQRREHPPIGVIRQLYFDAGQPEVGQALLDEGATLLGRFERHHAFCHILGMSCNAYHGKLHASLSHVEQLLQANGFEVEHENAYYVLDMRRVTPGETSRADVGSVEGSDDERFVLRLGAQAIGSARVRYLDRLTDGCTRDTVYLSWLGIDDPYRGQGLGAACLRRLIGCLVGKGYRYLHTDTASGNSRARRCYETLGFRWMGYTRSYVTPPR